jgi:hypothetical protein
VKQEMLTSVGMLIALLEDEERAIKSYSAKDIILGRSVERLEVR